MTPSEQHFTAEGFRFRIEPSAKWLVEGFIPFLERVAERPGATVLKRNPVRAVYRVPFPGVVLVVKRYHVAGPGEMLKYLFVRTRAMAEWREARALAAASIPTVRPLLVGEKRSGRLLRDAVLVTEEIPGTAHLVAYLQKHFEEPRDSGRRALLTKVTRLIRAFHDAGFTHGDLHGGNLLVTGPPEEPQVHVIDLHTVRGPGRVSRAARRRNLAKFLHSLRTATSGPEQLRLLGAYEGGTPVLGGSAARAVFARVERLERRRLASRSRRCVKRSSAFDHGRVGGFTVFRRREVPGWAPLHAVGDHLLSVWRKADEVLKDSTRSALSRQVLADDAESRHVVVKETKVRGFGDVLKNVFRRHRGLASWRNGNALRVRGVGAAEPLALVVHGRWPRIGPSWLLMEDLSERERVDLYVLRRWAGDLSAAEREEKRGFIRACGRFVGGLHRRGIYHGDLKAVNIFVAPAPDGTPEFKLVDYDRVLFRRRVGRRRRAKNLAQLAASVAVLITKTDRLRFYRAWAPDEEARRSEKVMNREVARACAKKRVVRMEPIE